MTAFALAAMVADASAQQVRPGFYIVGPFSGASFGEDAAIRDTRIQGTGTVYVPGNNPAVELIVRQKPNDAAVVVAYVGAVAQADGVHIVCAANEPNLVGEFERVSHEEYGLVADLVQGEWVRTVYGYTRSGQTRRGWVRLDLSRAAYKSYDTQIREHGVWFERPATVELFDRPNGRRIRFPLGATAENPGGNYTLEVLSIRGAWIEVQVTAPDIDPCTGNPEAKIEHRTRAWVRRYDRRGRYQIWYGPAGC